jgi:hypothetical protein
MGSMHTNRILLPLFVATSLAVDLVFVGSLSENTRWPATSAAMVMGLAAGQINLATLWGILASGHLPWRGAVLLVVPVGWGVVIARSAPEIMSDYDMPATWGVHLLTQTVLLASILVLIRLRGAVLLLDDLAANDRPRRRRQFTVRYLFAWLTSTAVAMSVLKTAFDRAKFDETDFHWLDILILDLVAAMIGLATAWLILDSRNRSKRVAATLITALLAMSVMGITLSIVEKAHILLGVFLVWLVAGLYSAAAWTVLRVTGFRLVWLRANPESRT